MGLRHRELAVEGVQFHPESVLTEGGHRMLANWLVICGDDEAVRRSEGLSPVVGEDRRRPWLSRIRSRRFCSTTCGNGSAQAAFRVTCAHLSVG